MPVHAAEYLVIDVLDGDIQVFDDFIIAGDFINQFVIELVGVEIVQANPSDAGNDGKPAAEFRQTSFSVPVGTVAGDVLCNHDQFFHSLLRQFFSLADNGFDLSGTVAAANIRDHAERAEVVTAFRNAQIGPSRTGGDDARDLIDRCTVRKERTVTLLFQNRIGGGNNFTETADAEDGVDFRELLENLFPAAGYDDRAEPPFRLQCGVFQNTVDGL